MEFNKTSRDTHYHIQLLEERGLVIEDSENLAYYLDNIGYYRLSGYMYPFQSSDGTHHFHQGTTFRKVLNHYIFDKKLRFLVLDALERIEISTRTNLSNIYAQHHGPHWFMNTNLFNNQIIHSQLITDLNQRCSASNELFIKAYRSKYNRPELPPSWMAFETLTFGGIASIFENLKDDDHKKLIAAHFGTFPSILESWMKSMLFIRNCCAHHSRLWNRRIPLKPMIPTRKKNRFLNHVDMETNQQLYGILSCIVFTLNQINPNCEFRERIKQLFLEFPDVNIEQMGFHAEWESEPLWQ